MRVPFDAYRAAAVDFSVVDIVVFFGRVVDQHVVYVRCIEGVFDVFEVFVPHDAVYSSQVVVFSRQCHVVDDDGVGGKAYRVGDVETGVEVVDAESESVDIGRAFNVQGFEASVEIDFTGGMAVHVFENLFGERVEKCQGDVLGIEVQVQGVAGGEDIAVDPSVGVSIL